MAPEDLSLQASTSTPPELTIVIPAYNEEGRVGETLSAITHFIARRGKPFEVIVVDDGSTDDTAGIIERYAAESSNVRLLRNRTNRGKGYSVRRGMLAGRGQRLLFSDADLSTPIEEIQKLEAAIEDGYDIAIGSRGLAASDLEIRQPWWREGMGKAFGAIRRLLALPDIRDSQCGFKLFSRRAVETIFPRQQMEGFAFDVEILLIARRHGLKIAEVPVRWRHSPDSKVHPIRSSLSMLLDLLRLRRRASKGAYE